MPVSPRAIHQFWFKEIDSIRFEFFVKLFLGSFSVFLLVRFYDGFEWLTIAGYHPTEFPSRSNHLAPLPLIPQKLLPTVVVFSLICCAAAILGFYRRLFIAPLLIFSVYIQFADTSTSFVINRIFTFVLLLLLLVPSLYSQHRIF